VHTFKKHYIKALELRICLGQHCASTSHL
jgi:hypothetical protein